VRSPTACRSCCCRSAATKAFNAGRVEQLEAGIRIPPDAPPERRIRIALRTLLTDPRFPAAATLAARRIAADEPDRTAAEAIERRAYRK
jgi:UDP:flavonoid glycosyltransferase YjiC (YdhE family)